MKLPQVTYGAVENITQGTSAITQQATEHRQNLALVDKVSEGVKKAYTAHAMADTRNKMVEYRSQLKTLEDEQTSNTNRNLDPQELRAFGVMVDSDAPVKGSLYAAPLFEKKAEALRAELGNTVPAMFREKFDAMSEDAAFEATGNVFNKAKQWKQDEDLADWTANDEKLLVAGMWDEARALAKAATAEGVLSEQQLVAALHNVDVTEAQAPALAAIADNSQERLEDEISKLRDPEYSGPLTAMERRSTVIAMEQRHAFLVREAERIQAEQQLQLFGDMEVGVVYANGKDRLNLVDIDKKFTTEQISTGQRNQLMMQYWARINREEKSHEQLINIDDAMRNGVKLSHSDSDHKKAVDAYTVSRFGTSIDAQKGTDEQRATFEGGNAIVAANTGVLSNEAKAYMIGMNRSGDPEKAVAASNFYSQLMQVAPQALSDVPEKDRVRLEVTASMALAGVPAAVAVKYGQEAADRSPEQQAEIRAAYMESIKADKTSNAASLENFLSSDNTFDPFFGSATPSNSKLRTEHETLVWAFFGQTGSLDLSRKMAEGRIRETWGRTEINGSIQAMKFAPEVRTGRSASDMRDELEAQVKAGQYTTIAGSVGGNPVPIDPKKVIIVPDARTGKDNKYALQIIRPDGMLDNVYTLDGKRAYWNPILDAKAAATKRTEEAMNAAKKKRDQYAAEAKKEKDRQAAERKLQRKLWTMTDDN